MNTQYKINYTDLILPYRLIDIELYSTRFVLAYVWFNKMKIGESIQPGEGIGQFAIAYHCDGLDADQLINMDIYDALRFYKELKFVIDGKASEAHLYDKKGRTDMRVIHEESGYYQVNASFKNKNNHYQSGISFTFTCTKKVFKKAVLQFEGLFRELVRLECLEENTDF